MRVKVAVVVLSCVFMFGCGGGSNPQVGGGTIAAPTVSSRAAQGGAVIVSLTSTVQGATIFYRVDGTAPTTLSQQYQGPFLVASNVTVRAFAILDLATSKVTSASFSPNIPSGTLVWSDEFTNDTRVNAQPDPTIWTYDTGKQPSPGVYSSARLKSQGLFSFQYGRLEFRALVPEAQGFWPAVWLLGNNIVNVNWPACGEMDVLERVNAAGSPDWNAGSIHGTGFTGGTGLGVQYDFPSGGTAAQWHIYGMIWTPGSVQYYIDNPSNIYASFTPSSVTSLSGAVWPFDDGQSNFLIVNLAIGGSWPGPHDNNTPFPSEMLVDYLRIYTN
jgi:beta-glucanase (GH16 family)